MLHAGHVPDALTGARAVPIYQTTSYVFDDADTAAQLFELKQYGNIYTRIGNPTTAVLEERMASLENATGAVAVASGMAAQFVALMTLLAPGDEIVASSHLYGGTVTQLTHTFRKLSVDVRFVDPTRLEHWEAGHHAAHPRALRRDGRQPAGQHPRPRAARRSSPRRTGSRSSSTTPSRRPISAGRWTGARRSWSTPRPSSSAATAPASAASCSSPGGSTTATSPRSRIRRPRTTASGSSIPSATTAS